MDNTTLTADMVTLTNTVEVPRRPIDPERRRKLARAQLAHTQWRERRDELIVEAYKAGVSIREIARVTDLSHPGVIRILDQAGAREDDQS